MFEPSEWVGCPRRYRSRRIAQLAVVARLHRATRTMLAALSDEAAPNAHWRDAELRAGLASLAIAAAALLGALVQGDSITAACTALESSAEAVRLRMSAARRATLYDASRHLDWHGAQLWAPMTLTHAMLHGAEAALELAAALSSPAKAPARPFLRSLGAAVGGALRSSVPSLRGWRRALREQHRWHRAARVTLAVVAATLAAVVATPVISGGLNPFWAPVTAAFVAGGSESGSFRTTAQRLQGTLLGASAGLGISLMCGPSAAALAVTLGAWSGALHFYRPGGPGSYWATVAAVTAPIIALGGAGDGPRAQAYALGRMELTWIGLAVFFVVTAVLLPKSARRAVRLGNAAALAQLDAAVGNTIDAYAQVATAAAASVPTASAELLAPPPTPAASAAEADCERSGRVSVSSLRDDEGTPATAAGAAMAAAAAATPAVVLRSTGAAALPLAPERTGAALDRARTALGAVRSFLAGAPVLLDEAAHEPQLWHRSFSVIKSQYSELTAALERAADATQDIHDAASALLRRQSALLGPARLRDADRSRPALLAEPPGGRRPPAPPDPASPVSILMGHAKDLAGRARTVLRRAATILARRRPALLLGPRSLWGWPALPSPAAADDAGATPAVGTLDADVAALTTAMHAFAADYDVFLHAVVSAAVGAASSAAASAGAPSPPASPTGAAHARLAGPNGSVHLMSNEVALSLYAVAFSLRELTAATLDVVRCTR